MSVLHQAIQLWNSLRNTYDQLLITQQVSFFYNQLEDKHLDAIIDISFLFLYKYMKQVDSMFPYVCSVIDQMASKCCTKISDTVA